MSLTQIAVNRPVTVAMFFLGIAFLGLLSLNQISIDFLPAIQVPELMIQTSYPAASPEEIEKQISEPVESILGTVPGVKHISSISREGLSLVRLKFYWGTNIDYAMLEVREKLDAVRAFLPQDAERPTILRLDPSTESIMTIALTHKVPQDAKVFASGSPADSAAADSFAPSTSPSTNWAINDLSLAQLKEFAETLVKRRLEQIHGVAQAVVAGGSDREINVLADPAKLASYGLSLEQAAEALQRANVHFSGGTLKQGVFRYSFRTISELETLRDIEQVALRTPNGHLVKLGEIARIEEGFAEKQGQTRVNGSDAILLFIRKEAGANTVRVSARVRATLGLLQSEYSDVSMMVLFEQAEFIKKSISDIQQAIFWGALLAFLVLFIFLRHPRYPLLIGIVTPFSILATIVMMYFAGITFNIISLTGLALGIGMVGDNAIIIVENFSRLREQGRSVRQAVLEGAKELNVTVSAATFTNVAIFLPVAFVHGVAQKLFIDMGLTMTFSLLASLLVAVTLVPALLNSFKETLPSFPRSLPSLPLTEKLLRSYESMARRFSAGYAAFLNRYLAILTWCLRHRGRVIGIACLLTLTSLTFAFLIRAEQAPDIDQSRFTIELTMPRGTALEATSQASSMIESALMPLPSVSAVVADIGISAREDYFSLLFAEINRARIEVKVKTGYPVAQAMAECRAALDRWQQQLSSVGAGLAIKQRGTTFERILQPAENDIEIRVLGEDMAVSADIAEQILQQAQAIRGLTDVRLALQQSHPEIRILLDRDRLGVQGLESSQVVAEVSHFLRGKVATYLSDFDRRIPVRVRPALPERTDRIAQALDYRLQTDKAAIPIAEIAKVQEGYGYSEIYHDNQNRTVLLYANAGQRNILNTVSELKATVASIHLPPGYEVQVGGKVDEILEAFRSLLIIVLLSLFLVYIILASEYESVLYPLVVLITSPLSLVGAFILMYLAGQSYNVMSIVGLVIMLGAIDNDTVIALDLIIANRRKGMGLEAAVLDGMRKRLRPIVMTTLTTILGIIPMLIGFGAGLELSVAISYPVIGGLFASTVAAMFLDPVLYTYFDRFAKKSN